jgi:4-amino-4-deoxy-L-arabinose transferase-like glycosyltransferase
MKRKPLLLALVALASLVYLAGLVHYAEVRPIDGEEGFYTTAARLVWEGKTPYRDFFYQHAPLLPYIYSWLWAIHPSSLLAMRLFSAACGGMAAFLWGVCLVSLKRLPIHAALAAFAVILLNPYWVSWNVVVKTYAVANLLMSIATICLYAALHSDNPRWYFLGGLALGACASVRSHYSLVTKISDVPVFRRRESRTNQGAMPMSLAHF